MNIITSGNQFDGYIKDLTEIFGFEQAFQTEESQDYIFFDCLKKGDSYEIRYDVYDNVYEVFDKKRGMFVDLAQFIVSTEQHSE